MSFWILEYRTRKRRNGKWDEWQTIARNDQPCTAYRQYPDDRIMSEALYECRAVEYVRKEPE